jgi:transposase InsO family protein
LSAALPARWPKRVRSAVIHAMSLAASALTATRGWAATHVSSRVRLKSEIERLGQELALVREELRLKDARMLRVPGHERPHYPPIERLAILELRALRGWTVRQTADLFHLSPVTVSSWMRRLDERGQDALVRSPVPLNKYPDFVTHIVQRLKLLCPAFGCRRIARILCREGLHLGKSTVRRMIRRAVAPGPAPGRAERTHPSRRVIARYAHHAWHCDLTTVPTSMGIWTSTAPFSLALRWPFCWWLVVVADQFSARILSLAIFRTQPSSEEVRAIVARAVDAAGAAPKYLITDRGHQFRDRVFRVGCKRMGIRHVFGALGQFGSIPFIERLIGTIKWECAERILVPFSRSGARTELALFAAWYNRVRPHERLGGATPDEIQDGAELRWKRARFETRSRWPRGARCAAQRSSVVGRCGAQLALRVRYLGGRRHLPVVRLERVA